jgi:DNA-binding PadR family transcriptional regulator
MFLYNQNTITKNDNKKVGNMVSKVERKLFLGFIQIHILYHASKEKLYGLWMIEELKEHGYSISPGTIYPMLSIMEKDGMLNSFEENVEGKIRKYYKTTKLGFETMNLAKEKAIELIKEIDG